MNQSGFVLKQQLRVLVLCLWSCAASLVATRCLKVMVIVVMVVIVTCKCLWFLLNMIWRLGGRAKHTDSVQTLKTIYPLCSPTPCLYQTICCIWMVWSSTNSNARAHTQTHCIAVRKLRDLVRDCCRKLSVCIHACARVFCFQGNSHKTKVSQKLWLDPAAPCVLLSSTVAFNCNKSRTNQDSLKSFHVWKGIDIFFLPRNMDFLAQFQGEIGPPRSGHFSCTAGNWEIKKMLFFIYQAQSHVVLDKCTCENPADKSLVPLCWLCFPPTEH